ITLVPVEDGRIVVAVIHDIRYAPSESAKTGDAVRISVIIVRSPIGEEDPVCAANHQLRSDLIGEPKPRAKILIVLMSKSLLACANGAVPREINCARQPGGGVDLRRIKAREPIVLLDLHGIEIPPQPEVQRESRTRFEIV